MWEPQSSFFLVFRGGAGVSNSAHAGPKLLAATGRLLLASPRLAGHLSRAGETKYSGCGAHPNQSEGFAWASCWRACLRWPRRPRPYRPGTQPPGGGIRPPQRSVLVCARERAARVHFVRPDLPMSSRQCASPAGFSARVRLVFLCPHFRNRASRGSRGKFPPRQRHCKELCEMARRAE